MVLTVQNREDAESFLMKINPYVIPFQEVTNIKKIIS